VSIGLLAGPERCARSLERCLSSSGRAVAVRMGGGSVEHEPDGGGDTVVCYGNADPGDVHLAATILAVDAGIYPLLGEPAPVSADADVRRSIAVAASC
jgi:hypothetical protein